MNDGVIETEALADDQTEVPGVCWDCHGPCLTYKGSADRWRCCACPARYMQRGQAAFDANQNDSSGDGTGRRGGGGLAPGRTATIPATTNSGRTA